MRGRWLSVVLVLLCAVVTLRFFPYSHPKAPAAYRPLTAPSPAAAQAPLLVTPDSRRPKAAAATLSPAAFVQRLHCSQYHLYLGHAAPPAVLPLLCAGEETQALKALLPLARAGDRGAGTALAFLAQCNDGSSTPPAAHRERLLALARQREATPETLQRLDALLAREESPSAAELERCRQMKAAFAQLTPRLAQDAAEVFGRPLAKVRGENEQDVQIEYHRKTLAPGDADAEVQLAGELLRKGTPESQAEAMSLLRAAADRSPRAQAELARCLLAGCPTAAADPREAQQLLFKAAEAGDRSALMILSAPDPEAIDPQLSAAERSAWGELRQRLDQEGCFDLASYASWAIRPLPHDTSLSLADAVLAQTRAGELISQYLAPLRQQLGCA